MKRRWYLLLSLLVLALILGVGLPLRRWWQVRSLLAREITFDFRDARPAELDRVLRVEVGCGTELPGDVPPITLMATGMRVRTTLTWFSRLTKTVWYLDGDVFVFCVSGEERDGVGIITSSEADGLRWYNAPLYYWF